MTYVTESLINDWDLLSHSNPQWPSRWSCFNKNLYLHSFPFKIYHHDMSLRDKLFSLSIYHNKMSMFVHFHLLFHTFYISNLKYSNCYANKQKLLLVLESTNNLCCLNINQKDKIMYVINDHNNIANTQQESINTP